MVDTVLCYYYLCWYLKGETTVTPHYASVRFILMARCNRSSILQLYERFFILWWKSLSKTVLQSSSEVTRHPFNKAWNHFDRLNESLSFFNWLWYLHPGISVYNLPFTYPTPHIVKGFLQWSSIYCEMTAVALGNLSQTSQLVNTLNEAMLTCSPPSSPAW